VSLEIGLELIGAVPAHSRLRAGEQVALIELTPAGLLLPGPVEHVTVRGGLGLIEDPLAFLVPLELAGEDPPLCLLAALVPGRVLAVAAVELVEHLSPGPLTASVLVVPGEIILAGAVQ
jgi:hypothetical protein